MEKPITILIAADNGLVAKGWHFALSLDPRFNVVNGCKDFESVLLRAKTLRPDVILMDVNMRRMHEMNVIPFIEEVSPGSGVLGICMYTFLGVSDTLIQSGVCGYLTKRSLVGELFKAIAAVKEGKRYLCGQLEKFDGCEEEGNNLQKGLGLLSLREMDVVAGVSNGHSLKEIALEFKVPYRAIKKHHENILKKLGLNNDLELMDYLANSPAL